MKVLQETVAQMSDMFPGVPIFPALGNHESSPVNRYEQTKGFSYEYFNEIL